MSILTTTLVLASMASPMDPPEPYLSLMPVPDRTAHHLTLTMGSRSMDAPTVGYRGLFDEGWYNRDSQATYGLSYHTGTPGQVGWEAGILFGSVNSGRNIRVSTGTGVGTVRGEVESESTEAYLGLRYETDTGSIRPYVGAGITLIDAEEGFYYVDKLPPAGLGSDAAYGSGSTTGFYLHGGANLFLDGNMSVGLDYRLVVGTEDIESYEDGPFAGQGVGMDSSMLSLTVGFGF